jgi:hypothetical protein
MEVNQNLRVEAGMPTSPQPSPPSEKTLDWYGTSLFVGDLSEGRLLFSEWLHQWQDFTGDIKFTLCTRHPSLSERVIVLMDPLNASLRMKCR